MKAVLDTNVLVSGVLNPAGAPGRILQLVVSGYLKLCYDSRILHEYNIVLHRPKFGFDKDDVHALLDWIRQSGVLVSPRILSLKLPDMDDLKFIEAGIAAKANYLVTGNLKHYPESQYQDLKIISPSDFLLSCARRC